MSNDALNWAIAQRGTPREKLVLIVLANRANDRHECWPSMASLTQDTDMSERSVQGAVEALRRSGLVIVENGGGRNRTNLYRLMVDRTPQDLRGKGARETQQKTAEKAQTVRGIDGQKTPQELTETPQNLHETPQDLQKTPHSLHPEPKRTPIEPKANPKRFARERAYAHECADLFAQPAPEPVAKLVAKPKAEKRARTRTHIPKDWWPDAAGIAFAAERGVKPHVEVQHFRDYYIAHGRLMADWSACWRTWCQNQVKFGRTARPGNMPDRNRPARPSRALAAAAAIAGYDLPGEMPPTIDHDDNPESWRESLI